MKGGSPMLRTVQFACSLSKAEADALNAESGRIYPAMLVRHYRVYRTQGVWLAAAAGERLEDALGGPATPHAPSRDAAQQGFYKACKPARGCWRQGLDVKYPHWRKCFRTTLWKKTGISRSGERVWLARARGVAPVAVLLPPTLVALPAAAFLEVRLVWDRAAQHYSWHVVVEDGVHPLPAPGTSTVAVDLGEIHPAALTDGKQTGIISCRALRANQQYTAKRLAAIRAKQNRKHKGSGPWKR